MASGDEDRGARHRHREERWRDSDTDSSHGRRSYRDVACSSAPAAPPPRQLEAAPAPAARAPASSRLGPRLEVHRVENVTPEATDEGGAWQQPRSRDRRRRPRRVEAPAPHRRCSPTPEEEAGLCFRCLDPGHHVRDCTNKSPDFASKAVDLAAGELLEVATPGNVTQEGQLDRAKRAAKCKVLMDLESRAVACEDIGRQVLTYGEREPIEKFLNDLEAITLNDISSTAKNIISTPLTMASWGDVTNVPTYESVSRKFHSK